MGLFSKAGSCTPLHCLARKKRGPDSLKSPAMTRLLYQFVVHIVCDLKAPLAALDPRGETCIHIAAENGDSAEVLKAFLDCDVDGSVREIRNSRGLTPLEVAKPEFRAVFGTHNDNFRSSSPASLRTVRPLHSYSSVPSLFSRATESPTVCPHLPRSSPSPFSLSLPDYPEDETPSSSSDRLLQILRLISHELRQPQPALVADVARLEAILRETAVRSHTLLSRWRARADETRIELHGAQDTWEKIDSLLDAVAQAVEDKIAKGNRSGEQHGRSRSGTTVSGDSQLTAVSSSDDDLDESISIAKTYIDITGLEARKPAAPTQAMFNFSASAKDTSEVYDGLLVDWPTSEDPADVNRSPPTNDMGFYQLDAVSTISIGHMRLKSYKSTGDLRRASPPPARRSSPVRDMAFRPRAGTLVGVMRDVGLQPSGSKSPKNPAQNISQVQKSGASRIKAWFMPFMRKIKSDRTLEKPLPTLPPSPQLRASTEPRSSLTTLCEKDETEGEEELTSAAQHRVSYRALAAAGKDLARIDECISNAEKFITSAYRCIEQAEHTVKKVIKAREMLIHEHHSANTVDAGIEAVFAWHATDIASTDPLDPVDLRTTSSLSPNSSAKSSVTSLSSTLSVQQEDDADTRVLERLLKTKIEARLEYALEEVEKVEVWLRIVKGVVRGAQRRADVHV
ncbi:hypothetical protein EW146_g224 [Bondarzewia mesenterica]|uniref:Uncharacterized protein n=1 Tax=Bondarzewia mesenterica TaxID=1095465 RepID=A0A4S4M9W3_9AGAM|nr:hypothetical protein EW146_g224 [Bondarzewia mesenterica]